MNVSAVDQPIMLYALACVTCLFHTGIQAYYGLADSTVLSSCFDSVVLTNIMHMACSAPSEPDAAIS